MQNDQSVVGSTDDEQDLFDDEGLVDNQSPAILFDPQTNLDGSEIKKLGKKSVKHTESDKKEDSVHHKMQPPHSNSSQALKLTSRSKSQHQSLA